MKFKCQIIGQEINYKQLVKKVKTSLWRQQRGSGKTTVLVERIINKIINEKIDIDKLLIVTFTNAAASEMKQRILEALYKRIEEAPEDENLQKQILLLNRANISTIHAFCLEIIKNYFYEIDISSNFRIGDTQEIELLKQESLEEIFDELYEEKNDDFIKLVNMFASYKDDEELKELILKIYNFSQSMPFPEEWINTNVQKFNINKENNIDFSNTIWGNILIEYFKQEVLSCINELKKINKELSENLDLKKYYLTITNDLEQLELIYNKEKWNDIYLSLSNLKFATWPRDKKTDCEQKNNCKDVRDLVKDKINGFSKKIFIYSSEEAIKDIGVAENCLKAIESIVLKFSESFTQNKREKNIIDFNDIEHFALKILLKKNEKGIYIPTEIAKTYKQKFEEIAIDEYQDSNMVQEYILNAISKNNNIFMVGDVKQSIYKFRGARPELFLEKYNSYNLANYEDVECIEETKIQLFQNFRSRKNILDYTNMVFENIMSKELGDINYNKDEFLNASALFEENSKSIDNKIELNIIDLKEQEEEEETENELLEKTEREAKFVAKRIQSLINEDCYILDKKSGYRKLTYKDIVILLRSTQNIAQEYEKELNKLNIPVFSDTSSNYFETEEIKIILSVLKIINNPEDDIPLVCVLRSQFGGFTENELLEIRLNSKDTSFYESLVKTSENNRNMELSQKTISFLNMLEDLQEKQEYMQLDELIWYLYNVTGFYDYTLTSPNGELKTANLKLLFEKAKDYEQASFKGLYNFINYIDKIKNTGGDSTSAKLIGENENVVRIMSIHKSKGLEFPVVFLSGTGKWFNMQDLNQSILLHQDIGFGPKIIDYERKIEYNTLAKEAIRIKLLNETLSEEMRLLYVALTRAKEKLIITGYDRNLEKSLNKKERAISENNKLNISEIRKSRSYLDWIELVYLKEKHNLNKIMNVNYYNKNQIVNEEIKETNNSYEITLNNFLKQADKNDEQVVNRLLTWKYDFYESVNLQAKTSVTAITHNSNNRIIEVTKEPKFMENIKKLTASEIGTLMHLIMQEIDFSKRYNKQTIEELIEELISRKKITEEESKYINVNSIIKFSNCNLYGEIQTAKQIKQEQPFYIFLDSNEVYDTNIKEEILVQGIIDLYFVKQNDEIVLVDYKTDYVKNEQELIKKYKPQLEIYKRALEQSLNKQVSRTYIYSLYLNKEIEL